MDRDLLKHLVSLALREDLGEGDVTTNVLVKPKPLVQADIWIKEPGVVCGLLVLKEVFQQVDKRLTFRPIKSDGDCLTRSGIIAHVYGAPNAILTAERVALNFLGLLSGIASSTRKHVKACLPYKPAILDTRKTTPLLREFERYAVRCGGGVNHRFDLSSMVLVKDNHRALTMPAMSFDAMVKVYRQKHPKLAIELEVDTLEEFYQAINAGAESILLDNMLPAVIKKAVMFRDKQGVDVLLEASGGITLRNIKQYAATGVDRISIGALTHHIQSLDVSLDIAYRS